MQRLIKKLAKQEYNLGDKFMKKKEPKHQIIQEIKTGIEEL